MPAANTLPLIRRFRRRERHGDSAPPVESLEAWAPDADLDVEAILDVFAGVSDWLGLYPNLEALDGNADYEKAVASAWQNIGIKDTTFARAVVIAYRDAGVNNPITAAWFYQHQMPPSEVAAWWAVIGDPLEPANRIRDDINRVGVLRGHVTVTAFEALVHDGRPLRPAEVTGAVEPLLELAARNARTEPAVLRRTIENLQGCTRTQALDRAVALLRQHRTQDASAVRYQYRIDADRGR